MASDTPVLRLARQWPAALDTGTLLLAVCTVAEEDPGRLWGLLSRPEQERAARHAQPGQRDASVVAHGLARLLLGSLCGKPGAALAFAVQATGKPFLCESDLCFNLSHTAGAVALAVMRNRPVGVDVERERPVAPGILPKVLHPDELARVPAPSPGAVLEHWVCKEAVTKAWGIGLRLPFNQLLGMPLAGGWLGYEHDGQCAVVTHGTAPGVRWAAAAEGTASARVMRFGDAVMAA